MIALALALTAASPAAGCSGYYSLVPKILRDDVPFSLQVQRERVRQISMDFGGFTTPAQADDHGAVGFVDPNNHDRYYLTCDAAGANLVITPTGKGAVLRYRLVRTRTDIWGVARAHHWPIGD